MLGFPVAGSRTWIWTMAAPALAASIDDLAICSGVTGTAGLRPGVSAAPVTAQEMITLRCIRPPQDCLSRLCLARLFLASVMVVGYSGPGRPCRQGQRDKGQHANENDHEWQARVHPASPVLPWPSGRWGLTIGSHRHLRRWSSTAW